MPINLEQFPSRDLIYSRVDGTFRLADYEAELKALAADRTGPAARNVLVDFSAVLAYEFDPEEIARQQTVKRRAFPEGDAVIRVAYLAPRYHLHDLAFLIVRAWGKQPNVVTTIVETEADALRFLEMPEVTIADLIAAARRESRIA